MLFAVVVLRLVSAVLCQEIGWEERLQNDLFCVEWDVKPSPSNCHTYTPFTRYNQLYSQFDNRMDVCLQDTAGCQTGCTIGLTIVLNEQPLFVQPVIKPGCTTRLTTGGIHDTVSFQTGVKRV